MGAPMPTASDRVRLAWRPRLSFSGEAAKKLFACPSPFTTVAHSPPPFPPLPPLTQSHSSCITSRLAASRLCRQKKGPLPTLATLLAESVHYATLIPIPTPPPAEQAPVRRASLLATTNAPQLHLQLSAR